MTPFTDGDVAIILRSIIDHNRRGQPTMAYLTVTAEGMPDDVYDQAYGYAHRNGMIKVSGQHNGVTRKGRRYMRSATVPATARRQGRTDFTVTTDEFDLPESAKMIKVADE